MSRLLLDTTFLIDAERAGQDLGSVIADDDDVAIAAVTVAELRVGALLADDRYRPARVAFLDDVLEVVPVIDYDVEVAETHAMLLADIRRQGVPREAHDLIIAATARRSGRVVVTADAGAFDGLAGVEVRPYR